MLYIYILISKFNQYYQDSRLSLLPQQECTACSSLAVYTCTGYKSLESKLEYNEIMFSLLCTHSQLSNRVREEECCWSLFGALFSLPLKTLAWQVCQLFLSLVFIFLLSFLVCCKFIRDPLNQQCLNACIVSKRNSKQAETVLSETRSNLTICNLSQYLA